MALRPFDGYPDSWGAQRASVFGHAGPASYVQIVSVAGTVPVTGGDTVEAVEAGLKFFDKVDAGQSDDGAFSVRAIPVTPSQLVGGPSRTYKLQWIANFTGAFGGQAQVAGTEVIAATNLSTVLVRLLGIGPK